MNTCSTCKYWGSSWEGICSFEGTISATKDKTTQIFIEATAHDDSGLESWLHTGPKFGCIHWEKI